MKVKITFTVENSLNAEQIDENLHRVIEEGATEQTVAGQIRDEFRQAIATMTMGNDINGKPIMSDIVDVSVYANSDESSVFSEWHKEN